MKRPLALAALASSTIILAAACASAPPPEPIPGPVPTPPPTQSVPIATPAPTAAPTAVASATPTAEPVTPPPPPARCPAGMAFVPGGKYTWGPKKEEVTVGDYCMDMTETTADQYAACVKAGKCNESFLKCAPQQTYGVSGKGNFPVVCVDLAQATAYCDAQSKRLPSEEEWEWAARGGAEGRTFPWGNDAPKDQVCWSGASKQEGPCEVGSHAKGDNPQGIHDLAGNVLEWTTSRNDKTSPVRDARGGSWKDGLPEGLKVTRPGAFQATYRCGFLGIRCVQPASAKN